MQFLNNVIIIKIKGSPPSGINDINLYWLSCLRRVWWYQRGNQNPYIEEEQTTQRPKRKRTTVHTTIYKTYT